MSYQVLARKWRPARFQEMVGQEHVLKALVNALDDDRLHHAYLFTGTRGVGKTSIARLFAKSLNCEQGVSSTPCGQCSACTEIAEGRFVDLIEVDAASRTKVEDTRELMENVQYAPTHGRYKVYLIDEVHMLSTHSFNALLKTLEEPPPHVKFLLATTDPQKLPITILSRCLQFNLKNLIPERIVSHLIHVLGAEQIPYEEAALWLLARSADGSMRDAMSLTDQAIAFGAGSINEADVRAMLGTIDQRLVYQMLAALAAGDGRALLAAVADLAQFSPDYNTVLGDLISVLHRIAIAQTIPDAADNSMGDREQILQLTQSLRAEDIQLYYQVALMGRKDLPFVPDAREGLEMVLLRMLAFRPAGAGPRTVTLSQGTEAPSSAESEVAAVPAPVEAAPAEIAAIAEANTAATNTGAAGAIESGAQVTAQANTQVTAQADTQVTDEAASVPATAAMIDPQSTHGPGVGDGSRAANTPDSAPVMAAAADATMMSDQPLTPRMDDSAGSEGLQAKKPQPEPAGAEDAPPWDMDEPVPHADYDASGYANYDEASVYAESAPAFGAESAQHAVASLAAQQQPSPSAQQSQPSEPSLQPQLQSSQQPQLAPDEVAKTDVEIKPCPTQLGQLQLQDWVHLSRSLGLSGMTASLASHLSLEQVSAEGMVLHFTKEQLALLDQVQQERIGTALTNYFGNPVQVAFVQGEQCQETPAQYMNRKREERHLQAIESIRNDATVQMLQQQFDAQIELSSVMPID